MKDSARRVVIVGGVAAGMSAATRLRRLDESAEIVVLESGDQVSFANCGLPYHVGGAIEDRSSLLRSADGMARRFRLDIRLRHSVTAVDRAGRTVRVAHDGAEHDLSYDALVLAEGAVGSALPSDGSLPLHALRTVADMDAIVEAIAGGATRAVVVGGGYIGLEAVENLVARGLDTTLVVQGDQVLPKTLDAEMAAPVHEVLAEHGVRLRFGAAALEVSEGRLVLAGGDRLGTDLVVDATGVAPASGLAARAGLTVGPTGGIAVDALQRTSDAVIWAAGDAGEKIDAVDGGPRLVALAGLANRHGRSVADAIAGTPTPSAPALGTAIVSVFGLAVATLGWTERRLIDAGRPHRVLHTHPLQHAAYFPGATELSLKLLVDADSDLILGAQVLGAEGADKRIDVLATAAAGGITASGLSRLELAYAPQFGSAKDAVNLAGGSVRTVQWHQVPALQDDGWTVVDVRSDSEFDAGAIPGAVNLPLDELRERHGELPAERLLLHCQVGQRGFTAARLLEHLGHEVVNLDGGYRTWLDGEETRAHRTGPRVD